MNRLFSLIVLVLMLLSCGTEPNEGSDIIDDKDKPVIAEITKVVDQGTRNLITEIDTADFTFKFAGESELLKNLKAGDILVDSTSDKAPSGYLRKIKSIENSSGMTVIHTEQGKLWEAIPKAKIRFKKASLSKSDLKSYSMAEGVTFSQKKSLLKTDNAQFNVFDFAFDKEIGTSNGKVNINGYASFDLEFNFDFDWDFDFALKFVEIDLFKTSVSVNQVSKIEVTSQAQITLADKFSIAKFNFEPWVFTIGPVPVVLVPQIELFMDVNGKISAELVTWVKESYEGEIGIKYTSDNGWGGIGNSDFNMEFHPPSIKTNANFSAMLGPEVKVMLYGVAGPTINIAGGCMLDAALTGANAWDLGLYIGLKSEAGVEVSLLGFDLSYDTELFNIRKKIFSLDNEPFNSSINITEPLSNAEIYRGSSVAIKTKIVGKAGNEVRFYIDGTLQKTITSEPYEFIWDTGNSSFGNHKIKVELISNGSVLSEDEISVMLVDAGWQEIDMSQFGLGDVAMINAVRFRDQNNGFLFAEMSGNTSGNVDGLVLKTTDGGTTWKKVFEGNARSPVFLSDDHFVISSNKGIFETYNGGESFELVTDNFGNEILHGGNNMALNSKGEIVAIQMDGGFAVSRAKLATAENILIEKKEFSEYKIGFGLTPKINITGNKGIIVNVQRKNDDKLIYLTTTDGGKNWDENTADFQNDFYEEVTDLFYLNEDMGWLVGGSQIVNDLYVAKTTDGSKSFTKQKFKDINVIADNPMDYAKAVWFISPQIGYLGLSDFVSMYNSPKHKLYKTTDGGANWVPVEDIPVSYGIRDIFFIDKSFGWAVGLGNKIYKFSVK